MVAKSFLCYPGKGHIVYPCLPRDFGCKKICLLEVVRYEVWKVSWRSQKKEAGWWFHIFLCFILISLFRGKFPNLTHIFQMAWNHQLGSQYCSSSRFLDGYSKLVDGLVESFTSAGGTVKTGAKAQSQQWRWDYLPRTVVKIVKLVSCQHFSGQVRGSSNRVFFR